MRRTLKVLFLLLLTVSTLLITFLVRSQDDHPKQSYTTQSIEEIDCLINQDQAIKCHRLADEVFIPFSFIREYFEVYGSLITQDDGVRFDWSHSNNVKINYPKGHYNPKGIFAYFENYNVEMRDRVKCVSATEGVPISTQWESQGYYYPTQIAQFGLSHYSKNLTEPEPTKKLIDDGELPVSWNIPNNGYLKGSYNSIKNTKVRNFGMSSSDHDSGVSLQLDQVLDLVLSLDIFFYSNSSFTVSLENRETKWSYNITYLPSDVLVRNQDDNIFYGTGVTSIGMWKHLTRDLLVDLQKGLQLNSSEKKRKFRRNELKITKLIFNGNGLFDNITFARTEHIAHFYDAAEWFVQHQDDDTGGWPNPVRRKLTGFNELKQGWYSAMGQGHAISLLARAYYHSSGDERYLNAAFKGLKPFRIPSRQGGVLARFMGKFDWYEEYPTTPASYVLNGFIYSLLGLYDLSIIGPADNKGTMEAVVLFRQGMISLKKLLPLFDTGSGTYYDLRHFTLGGVPNLARWDYHATHVAQLLLLSTIDDDPLISQTGNRWKEYMFGKRAPHN